MSRRAFSLIELFVIIALFVTLAAILTPLSAQLIRHGQTISNSPGPRFDYLAWELRHAAAIEWQIAEDYVLLNGKRWHNTALGVACDDELWCATATLHWLRDDDNGGLRLILSHEGRSELAIEALASAEIQP